MKLLLSILLLTISLLADSDSILLSGISKHTNATDKDGVRLNEKHYGIGYQYSSYTKDSLFYTITHLAMEDSYGHLMVSSTLGANYMLLDERGLRISLGSEFGLVSKKIKISDIETKEFVRFDRQILPVLFIPKLSFDNKRFLIHITYVPKVTSGTKTIDEVIYMNIGYRF